ncbi:hypothetical protein ACSSS7_004496 [Eimeria intestinalis]
MSTVKVFAWGTQGINQLKLHLQTDKSLFLDKVSPGLQLTDKGAPEHLQQQQQETAGVGKGITVSLTMWMSTHAISRLRLQTPSVMDAASSFCEAFQRNLPPGSTPAAAAAAAVAVVAGAAAVCCAAADWEAALT